MPTQRPYSTLTVTYGDGTTRTVTVTGNDAATAPLSFGSTSDGGGVSPYVLCGQCIGGSPGCGTATQSNGDSYGNNMSVSFHWCWDGVSVSNYWGWSSESPCSIFCSFAGWNYAYQFNYGYKAEADFNIVNGGIFHLSSNDAACVAVNQYGNSWRC